MISAKPKKGTGRLTMKLFESRERWRQKIEEYMDFLIRAGTSAAEITNLVFIESEILRDKIEKSSRMMSIALEALKSSLTSYYEKFGNSAEFERKVEEVAEDFISFIDSLVYSIERNKEDLFHIGGEAMMELYKSEEAYEEAYLIIKDSLAALTAILRKMERILNRYPLVASLVEEAMIEMTLFVGHAGKDDYKENCKLLSLIFKELSVEFRKMVLKEFNLLKKERVPRATRDLISSLRK